MVSFAECGHVSHPANKRGHEYLDCADYYRDSDKYDDTDQGYAELGDENVVGRQSDRVGDREIVPALPSYTFNTAGMTSEVSLFPHIMPGTSLTIAGTAGFNGTTTDTIANLQWTATAASANNAGTFNNTNSANPVWSAPNGFVKTDPPFAVNLNVKITTTGGVVVQCPLTLTVDPSLLTQ